MEKKSIEERAYEHYPIKRIGLSTEIAASDEGWEGYIKGATEQEEITKKEMIEKLKKSLSKILDEEIIIGDISDSNDVDYCIGSTCFGSYKWEEKSIIYKSELINDLVEKTIKAMEE